MASDDNNPAKFMLTLALVFYALTMTLLFAIEAASHKQDQLNWRKQCIERGVAEYDRVTGDWKWTKKISAEERKECE